MNRRTESASIERPIGMAAAQSGDFWDYVLIAAIFTSMAALAYAALATPLLDPLVNMGRRGQWSGFWLRPTIIWITMAFVLQLLRTILWLLYRPYPSVAADDAPALTVIIPAYNEGAMVENSIASVAAANYPRDRLEIIAIDDGSNDDTWHHIQRAALRFPGLVTPIRLPEKSEQSRGRSPCSTARRTSFRACST